MLWIAPCAQPIATAMTIELAQLRHDHRVERDRAIDDDADEDAEQRADAIAEPAEQPRGREADELNQRMPMIRLSAGKPSARP